MSKLMIKASLGSDIRRVSIHNEELTYDELILMLQRVFRGKLSNEDDILLKYKDEDDDLITIFDSADLAFALEVCPVLKLTLFLNGEGLSEEENGESALKGMRGVQSVKAELRQIRDRVNRLLDYLEDKSGSGPKVEEDDLKTKEASTEDSVNGEQSKEFDPLQGKNVKRTSLREDLLLQ
ncbi:protein TFG-like isoform X1 [Caligus rogercresseyi]|uniref:Protein TFG-like isoform X1 n=1 Tax=Caligus rogercresseyi TaxID=217165 RepID=A0A7T8KH83_CALRO|nr:protein TFG-like isoform X1 [Caligus rogercresseyi]